LETGLHASDGTPLAAQFNSLFTVTGTGTTVRIDAGGTSPYHSASTGYDWSADASFTGGTARTVTNTINPTTDAPLYQSERYGTYLYKVPVPLGFYDIKMTFVELTYTATGKRIFSVDVLNQSGATPEVNNLDIYAMAGANHPYTVTVPNVQISTGLVQLKAIVGTDQPEIAAIEVIPHPPTAGTPTPA